MFVITILFLSFIYVLIGCGFVHLYEERSGEFICGLDLLELCLILFWPIVLVYYIFVGIVYGIYYILCGVKKIVTYLLYLL